MAQTSDPDQIIVVTSAPASAGKSTEDMRALVRASQSEIAERALENYDMEEYQTILAQYQQALFNVLVEEGYSEKRAKELVQTIDLPGKR